MGCVEENGQCEDEALPHQDLEFYWEEPFFCDPLNSCPLVVVKNLNALDQRHHIGFYRN